MKIFQYWDTGSPPPEVREWMDGVRDENPDFEYVRLNEARAHSFIAENCTPRELTAFRSCAVPAMQADYLRLCLMDVEGGVYVDADMLPLEPLASLIEGKLTGLIPKYLTMSCNHFMMLRGPGNLFNRAVLDLATHLILERRVNSVLMATGPGALNAVRAVLHPPSREELPDELMERAGWNAIGWRETLAEAVKVIRPTPELLADYLAIDQMDTGTMSRWFGLTAPAYKNTDVHWERWKSSVYRD